MAAYGVFVLAAYGRRVEVARSAAHEHAPTAAYSVVFAAMIPSRWSAWSAWSAA